MSNWVKKEDLYIDEPCVTSMFFGEFGWFISRWQGYLRNLKMQHYPDHKFILMTNAQFYPIVSDFVDYIIDLPDEFKALDLETDCYEAPEKDATAGGLTPPNVYSDLLDYLRQYYNRKKAIETLPPRGCNNFVLEAGVHQAFCEYDFSRIHAEKPIITVFPRGRARASNRNIPEFVWKEFVDIISEHFTVVLGGTPSGAFLADYEKENVINLIKYNNLNKLDLIMHYIGNSILTVSSQSGPTHLSLACRVPSYIIVHEKKRHTETENFYGAPTTFRKLTDYRAIDAETMISDINKFMTAMVNHYIDDVDDLGYQEVKIMGKEINKNGFPRTSFGYYSRKKPIKGAIVGVGDGHFVDSLLRNYDIDQLFLIDPYTTYIEVIESENGKKEAVSSNKEFKLTSGSFQEAQAKGYLKRYSDKITWIKDISSKSVDKLPDNLDFIYFNGNPDIIPEDIGRFVTKLGKNGIISGHNYENNTVKDSIDSIAKDLENNVKLNKAYCIDNYRIDWWFSNKEK